MVQAALGAGHDMPQAGVAYIKQQYGVDMTTGNFSATKNSLLKKKGGKKGKRGAGAKPATAAAQKAAAQVSRRPAEGTISPSDAAARAKELVDRVGAEEANKRVALFGG